MEKQSRNLDRIVGAWADNGQDLYTTIGIKCEYDLGQVTTRVRKAVIRAMRTGVLGSTTGMGANVFQVLSGAYDLKWTCASVNGSHFRTNFENKAMYESCCAILSISPSLRGRNARQYIHSSNNGMHSWSWYGGVGALEQVYADTVGFEDKETREEAINLLSAGGTITQTWIDSRPR